jgi:hypothetical protein
MRCEGLCALESSDLTAMQNVAIRETDSASALMLALYKWPLQFRK